jgi:hypothetical protein
MNGEEVKADGLDIVERLAETKQAIAFLAGAGVDIPEEARELQTIMERCVSAEAKCSTAPQWRDKPTCAGLWLFLTAKSFKCVSMTGSDLESPFWQRRCFGPIPERPAT